MHPKREESLLRAVALDLGGTLIRGTRIDPSTDYPDFVGKREKVVRSISSRVFHGSARSRIRSFHVFFVPRLESRARETFPLLEKKKKKEENVTRERRRLERGKFKTLRTTLTESVENAGRTRVNSVKFRAAIYEFKYRETEFDSLTQQRRGAEAPSRSRRRLFRSWEIYLSRRRRFPNVSKLLARAFSRSRLFDQLRLQ